MRKVELTLLAALFGALFGLTSCASHATAQTPPNAAATTAILRGKVTMGPTMPVERIGGPPAIAPVVGARVDITNANGVTIASVITGADGSYSAPVAPGDYLVTVTPAARMLGRIVPRSITVTPGTPAALDITLDTGIR